MSDWTCDGFVLIREIQVSGQRLVIKGKRLLVVTGDGGVFGFYVDNPKKRKKKEPSLEIDVDLGSGNPTLDQAQAAISKVFLTERDNFGELVPDYWKPCVPAGLMSADRNCHFSPEFALIPGFALRGHRDPALESGDSQGAAMFHPGGGARPPRAIRQPTPDYSDAARQARVQGTLTLGLIVDASGDPQNIHVLSPLGCGLDLQAVRAVSKWKFEPGEIDGQPLATQIAVEVDFHLQ